MALEFSGPETPADGRTHLLGLHERPLLTRAEFSVKIQLWSLVPEASGHPSDLNLNRTVE